MKLDLIDLQQKDTPAFKKMFQDAFQKGFEDKFGKSDLIILPEKDIDFSLNHKGSHAYKAVMNNEMVGGVVVVINEETQINELHLLCVKNDVQSKGIGREIYFEIERLFPNTKKWTTCTPCFETRNIHFYTEVCGFKITRRYDEIDTPEGFVGDGGEGMFDLEKEMEK